MRQVEFFAIVSAFTHFAGKPLRCVDAVDVLDDAELAAMRGALVKVADRLEREDVVEFPELHKLAGQIRRSLRS
jgi:hypothetical protein